MKRRRRKDGRLLCWQGKRGEERPGCGGCRWSALRRNDSGQACKLREGRFYSRGRRDEEIVRIFDFLKPKATSRKLLVNKLGRLFGLSRSRIEDILKERSPPA